MTGVSVTLQPPCLCSSERHKHGISLQSSINLGLDCEESLFSSKIRGKERKTSKRASVTWERRCREPLVAWVLGDEPLQRHAHSHVRCVLRGKERPSIT